MNIKTIKFNDAIAKANKQKIVLYHILSPISEQEFNKIQQNGYFNPSKNALGGQSNGYYFFTTRVGAENHIKSNQNSWDFNDNKTAYIIESEIDLSDVKYPTWKLDTEAMQDFLFDMIYDAAKNKEIKINNLRITAGDKKTLNIFKNEKISRVKDFCANDHSGTVEQVSDFLYRNDKNFQQQYDKLLSDVFLGVGENLELYAVKTANKQKITNITKIENKTDAPAPNKNSQINKFMSRYGNRRR